MSYLKAIVAAGIAGLTAVSTALTDGVIYPEEWVAVAIATLVGLGAVYATPNKEV